MLIATFHYISIRMISKGIADPFYLLWCELVWLAHTKGMAASMDGEPVGSAPFDWLVSMDGVGCLA